MRPTFFDQQRYQHRGQQQHAPARRGQARQAMEHAVAAEERQRNRDHRASMHVNKATAT
jgi:hypothetical protein